MWLWLKDLVGGSLEAPASMGALRLKLYRALRNYTPGPDAPGEPLDPESWVRSPRGRGPSGRLAAVAVGEPDDEESVVAVGRRT